MNTKTDLELALAYFNKLSKAEQKEFLKTINQNGKDKPKRTKISFR